MKTNKITPTSLSITFKSLEQVHDTTIDLLNVLSAAISSQPLDNQAYYMVELIKDLTSLQYKAGIDAGINVHSSLSN